MSDIATAERRLSAALDRIDYLLETGRLRGAAPAAPDPVTADPDLAARLDAALADNERLSQELAKALAQPSAPDVDERLHDAGAEIARLAAANEELAAANRALIEAQPGENSDQASIAALEAEIQALRAAREAEIAQLGDIMAELERLLGAKTGERG
ncbi:MAG: hypothetical protein Q4G14_11105 [Paracoccus sp. (in: a-proteobacteria)]|uniref:hypothetical protein n=1 Tax=Paracoccus sp. TaxID=267 RepID=UPI0026DEB850|nr:hypothetical protein [Paracoccus sp. (in: a-proteobacteria)]MDO5613772.1 hypothetical protein [Paracoccus sp. (in: a-proteobacteria)]